MFCSYSFEVSVAYGALLYMTIGCVSFCRSLHLQFARPGKGEMGFDKCLLGKIYAQDLW